MRKANILYVITKLELGGAQKQFFNLAQYLDKEKYSLFIFTAQEGMLLDDFLSIKEITLKKSKYLQRAINPLKDLQALIEIYQFIKKNNIDIVHTHSSKAGILGRWAARFANVKVVLHTIHGWSFNDYQSFFVRRIFIGLERITARFTHKLIVVSKHDREKGLKNRVGKAYQYLLIRYGINYAEFQANGNIGNTKEELGIRPQELSVVMVSCFKPQKSPQDFIKLASLVNRSLSDVKFILVGDGSLRRKIEKLIRRFNLQRQIVLTGWRRDIPRILQATDIFVLTSLWEGLPVSTLEAMATSKPIVATDTGGIREVIAEGKSGFLVAPRDMQEMSERLIMLLGNANLRKSMGQNARCVLSTDFGIENMIDNTQRIYDGLIEEVGKRDAN